MKKIIFVLLVAVVFASSTDVTVETLVKTSKSWDGVVLQSYMQGSPEVTILKITIPPKTKLALHEHPIINAGVLLKGELTVTTEKGEILHLKEGEAIVEVVNKWHYGENTGDTDSIILVFYAGIKNTPITIKEKRNHF